MAIFWGIMLAWIIPSLLAAALVVILFIIGVLGAASLSQPSSLPNPNATPMRQR
jgi:hypothetical protein